MPAQPPPDEVFHIKTMFGTFDLSANELASYINKTLVRSEVYIGLHNTVCATYNDLHGGTSGGPNVIADITQIKADITEIRTMLRSFFDAEDPHDGQTQPQDVPVPVVPPGN